MQVPKSPTKRSEDGLVVTDDFIAVIDGSTSKATCRCYKGLNLYSRSNGELAMRLVSKHIRRLPKTATCHQFCVGVTHYLRQHYKPSMLDHLTAHPEDRLTASAIIFSRVNRELWMIGDCQCLLTALSSNLTATLSSSTYYDNPKPYEQELAERRAAIIAASTEPTEHFLRNDTARAAIIPYMLETMKQQNVTYSVIDGFPIPEQHVRIITLDFQPWEIVMATDGYPFLCPTLAESEARLAQQKAEDPLNIGLFKATKAFAEGNNSFDDRTYIRFRV